MSDTFINDNTLFILDSYGLIYREYFAFITHPLTDSNGRNISAVFGFFRNLSNILKKYKPAYMIAAFDSRTPTFRHQQYPEYKATRQKTPDDLKAQFPWIEQLLGILGIPVIRCDGFEADDIIATLARKCDQDNRHCCILSADKDLMQLTNTNIHIMKPDKIKVWAELNEQDVTEEWGVEPSKLLDLLSLMGDSADNVPGVKGVGPKTAVKLINEYGSLEEIYKHSDQIKGSIGEKIRNDEANAKLSKSLITLRYDVPCIDDIENYSTKKLNYEQLAKELLTYQIPAVAKIYSQLSDSNFTAKNDQSDTKETELPVQTTVIDVRNNNTDGYKAVTDIKELTEYINHIFNNNTKIVAFDTETDSLDTHSANLIGFSLSYTPGSGIYIPLIITDSLLSPVLIQKKQAFDQLARLFSDKDVTIVMHNAKFDLKVLWTNGFYKTLGIEDEHNIQFTAKLYDTMIAAWLCESDKTAKNAYSLEYLAETKLGLKGTSFEQLVAKGSTFADVPLDQASKYGAEDADFTLQLYYIFDKLLTQNNLYTLFNEMEMQVLPILASMEHRGIHLDKQYLYLYGEELKTSIKAKELEIYKNVGHEFNIASTKQLQEVLFTERGLPAGKKTKTGYSTDTAVLEELAHIDIVPKMILEYRAMTKLLSTYVETLPELADEQQRIHTTFLQTGTATGRLSSKDPNLQNIPVRDEAGRKIRSAFTALPGTVLISADYAQIELVLLAHLSNDKNLSNAFITGTDVHKATAALIYNVDSQSVTPEMRRSAKTINFGVMYGMSAFRLANELNISRSQASQFIKNYFEQYAGVDTLLKETINHAEENGYVETLMGRKRIISSINSKNKLEKSGAERIAVNTPIQGSAADIVKKAMIDVDKALKQTPTGARLLLQVHDELIFECPDDEDSIAKTIKIITEKMENTVKLNVPLRVSVEYGKNWGEFH